MAFHIGLGKSLFPVGSRRDQRLPVRPTATSIVKAPFSSTIHACMQGYGRNLASFPGSQVKSWVKPGNAAIVILHSSKCQLTTFLEVEM